MNIRHLRIFLAVCQYGNMTTAAKHLYISQPSISLAIAELEEHYGIQLFDRISQRLHITQAGEQFRQYAQHVIGLLDEMESNIKNWDNVGELRLGASITMGNHVLPNLVSSFQKKYPDLKIRVYIYNSERIEQMVLENKIDLGFVEHVSKQEFIHSHDFMKDHLTLICANDHPWAKKETITAQDLMEENFLLREKGSAGRDIFDSYLSLHGMNADPLWESMSSQAIIHAVEKGIGVSILPYLLVKDHLDQKKISSVRIDDVALTRKFSIIYHKNKFLFQAAREFIDQTYTYVTQFPDASQI